MSEQNRQQSLAESISALVDGQASELELQRILKTSEQDPEVNAAWMRYQLVGSLLRGEKLNYGEKALNSESGFRAMSGFSQRVSAAIATESPAVRSANAKQGLWYQLGRVALVASVAGGMVLGVQQFNSTQGVGTEIAAIANTAVNPAPAVSLPSGINTQAVSTRTVAMQSGYELRPQENRRVMFKPHPATASTATTLVSDEEVTQYVNKMIQAHSDNAVMNSNQGVLPYARVIVTEDE